MAGASSIRLRDDGALVPWILGPLVGLAVLVLIGTQLQEHRCVGGLGAEPLGRVFEAAGYCSVLALLGLGIWRWTIVLDRRERRLDPGVFAAAATVLVAMFAGLVVVAVVDFDGLIVRAVGGRKADEAGALVAIYLLGCCFFLYAPFVLYENLRVGGCFP